MRLFSFLSILVFIFSACQKTDRFPEKVTKKVTSEEVILNDQFFYLVSEKKFQNELLLGKGTLPDSLHLSYNYFKTNDEKFNLDAFIKTWKKTKSNINQGILQDEEEWIEWYKITGLLFELTGNAQYSTEMERLIYSGISDYTAKEEFNMLVKPFIYTKNVDHIHLNFFIPASITFNHSFGGKIQIKTETDYPENGNTKLKFSSEEKQYIELYVRIPDWADKASVIVKNVKYSAKPGEYCKIAKKWRDGDVVEIQFQGATKPDYLR